MASYDWYLNWYHLALSSFGWRVVGKGLFGGLRLDLARARDWASRPWRFSKGALISSGAFVYN